MNAEATCVSTPVSRDVFSDAEWDARVQLAACYRVFDYLGWTELIFNHITIRVPGPESHFLINPYGLQYREVRASNLVKIGLDGQVVGQSDYPVNPAGFIIHSAIHRHVPNAHCVMHTHTTAGVAVASTREGITPTNFYGTYLKDACAYHDFEGVTINPDEQPRLLNSIGDKRAIVLRNHGLLSMGETLADAFFLLWNMQRACEIQIATNAVGTPITVSDEICERAFKRGLAIQPSPVARNVFNSMVRIIDKSDASYKD